jgi:GGDEF domain-containing protein
MDKGKVHESKSLDAGKGRRGGPPLAFGVGTGRRREDEDIDVRESDSAGELVGSEGKSELVVSGADWLWLNEGRDGLRSSSLVDSETGLHTALGIERRLKELAELSQRNDEPFTCVLFGADPVAAGRHVTTEVLLAAAARFGERLRGQTRRTDVVGRLEPLKYVVLAPRTPPFGGLRLAERFTSASVSWFLAGESPVTFGAGVAGVEGRGGNLEARPDLLVAAARRALADARMAGEAQIAAAWLDI